MRIVAAGMDSMLLVSFLRSFVHDAGTDWLQPFDLRQSGTGLACSTPIAVQRGEGGGMALTTQRRVLCA